MKLSDHFTLAELTRSATAEELHIDNSAPSPIIVKLSKLCNDILEPVRVKYLHPIKVNSGYRCEALNTAIRGAKNSQHMYGEAVDIRATHTDNASLFYLILGMIQRGEITVGQLIWEYGSKTQPRWIHLSSPRPGKPNNQVLYLYDK